MSNWQPIKTAPKAEELDANVAAICYPRVDLWLTVPASPRSMGISDAWRVIDCWQTKDGKWWHRDGLKGTAELYNPYVTHWMPVPDPPEGL